MEWYLKVLKQYADFKGRARRKEYWMYFLFNAIIVAILSLIDQFTGTYDPDLGSGLLSRVYSIAVLIPGVAVAARRLHDVGKSGWMLLIAFIPILGLIWLLVLFVTDSDQGSNKYGPNPKGIG